MKYDYLIVGCGYAGAILAERIATQLNKKVLIVEQRNHIAGNAYDYYDEYGILVHKYGPHLFHTSSKKSWEYLSNFTEWKNYQHRVRALVEGISVPVPFNLNSIYLCFPKKFAEKLEQKLLEKFGYGLKIPILKLLQIDDTDLKFLADYIYKNVFYGYTVKQWGLTPEELDSSVTSRIPVYISRDDRYFYDNWQAVPKLGYTEMFKKMLNHPNIHLLLQVDYKQVLDSVKFDRIIYTGPIDYFFDFQHGKLPYRSLSFEFKTYHTPRFQEVMQMNFPNNHDFTRSSEFNHINETNREYTTVAYEFPHPYIEGVNEPYYPIPKAENHEQYKKYTVEAQKLGDSVIFVGRLAEYKYYNMDQVVGVALQTFEKRIAGIR